MTATATPSTEKRELPCALPSRLHARYVAANSGQGTESIAALDALYLRAIDAVSLRYASGSSSALGACCESLSKDAILGELCSAARVLREHGNDDGALVAAMPRAKARIDASNDLDLILNGRVSEEPDPFARYYGRLWELARNGDTKVLDGFLVMLEQSHGIFAESAELALCGVLERSPTLFSSGFLPSRHPRTTAELVRRCPLLKRAN